MTQEIKPTYVTFEQAKFIRYPFLTNTGYSFSGKPIQRKYIPTNGWINRPEQWQVVEWLRVNHGIWVWVRPYKDHAADNNDPIQHQMNVYKRGVTVSKEFNSHEEAYSAAFDYIKENGLI
jgi:hypothetical protein